MQVMPGDELCGVEIKIRLTKYHVYENLSNGLHLYPRFHYFSD